MRRPTWFRALATVLALWFPLVAGEPGMLHPCEMHGNGAAIAASMHGAAAMHAQMHGASSHGAETTHGPAHQHHQCTCISCCPVGGTALRAPDAPRPEPARVAIVAAAALPNVESLPRPAPAFTHPHQTGPPRA